MFPLKLKFPSTCALPLTSSFVTGAVVPMPTLPPDCEITEFVNVVLFFHTAILPAAPVPETSGVACPLFWSWATQGEAATSMAVTAKNAKRRVSFMRIFSSDYGCVFYTNACRTSPEPVKIKAWQQ